MPDWSKAAGEAAEDAAVEPAGDAGVDRRGAGAGPSAGDARWRERAIERSLRAARARAVSRSDRFLAAATAILSETGRADFTVQEVVERSKTSLRSFYQHFASKDELLLALFEEAIRMYITSLRAEVEAHDDPVDRLRVYVLGMYNTTVAAAGPLPRALAEFHLRLAVTQPPDVAHALEPQTRLLHEIIEAGVAAGRFRGDVSVEQLVIVLSQNLIAAMHMTVLGTHVTGSVLGPDALWAFCLGGVSPPAPVRQPDRSSRGARAGRAAREPGPPVER